MFQVGLMAVCSIYINVLFDDMPFKVHLKSAYGTIVKVEETTAIINFEEFIDKYNFPRTKVVGDYKEVKVSEKDCIPF